MSLSWFRMPACPECGARVIGARTDYLLFAGRPVGRDLYRMEPCGHTFERREHRSWVEALTRTRNKSTLVWLGVWLFVLTGATAGLVLLLDRVMA